MEEELRRLKRGQRVNRALLVIVLLLFVCIIAAACVAGLYVYRLANDLMPMARKFAETDWTWLVDQLSKADLGEVDSKLNTITANIESLSKSVEALLSSMPK